MHHDQLRKEGDKTAGPIPWRLGQMTSHEALARDWIGNRFPGGVAGIQLKTLAELLRLGNVRLLGDGIAWDQPVVDEALVLVALSQDAGVESKRAVLGIPLELAFEIVDMALGRRSGHSDRGLSGGEQGALLYALDRVGSDWLAGGGASFVVRGFLADTDQMTDYLESVPKWQVKGRLRGDSPGGDALGGRVWLRFSDPITPQRSLSQGKDVGVLAAEWPVHASISIGWSRVPLDDLHDLSVGDWMVLDEGVRPGKKESDGYSTITSGTWKRYGRWVDRHRIQMVSPKERETIMDTKAQKAEEVEAELKPSSDPDSGSMEVVVQVEVGQVKMTVAKAASLLPGRVLRLNRDVTGAVVLKVGEKIIAKGELVDHEGTLAVEVLEVL